MPSPFLCVQFNFGEVESVYIHDYKGMATESYFLRININGENAIWEEIDRLTKEAGLDREPLNPVVRN